MASHRGAAALLLITSLLVAVALITGADARPTVRPDKTAAALPGADVTLTARTNGRALHTPPRPRTPGYVVGAAAPAVAKPECEDDGDEDANGDGDDEQGDDTGDEESKPNVVRHNHNIDRRDPHKHYAPAGADGQELPGGTGFHLPAMASTTTVLEMESEEPKQELCSTWEPEPKPKPEPPPCNTYEQQEPKMTCNKVHAVQEGETCDSVGKCAGLGHDDFLRFNPNICCDHLFCLEATCA